MAATSPHHTLPFPTPVVGVAMAATSPHHTLPIPTPVVGAAMAATSPHHTIPLSLLWEPPWRRHQPAKPSPIPCGSRHGGDTSLPNHPQCPVGAAMAATAPPVDHRSLISSQRSTIPPPQAPVSTRFRPDVTGLPLPLRYSRWELRGSTPQPPRQGFRRRSATELKDRSARLWNCAGRHCFGRVPGRHWQGGRNVRQFRKTIAQVTDPLPFCGSSGLLSAC